MIVGEEDEVTDYGHTSASFHESPDPRLRRRKSRSSDRGSAEVPKWPAAVLGCAELDRAEEVTVNVIHSRAAIPIKQPPSSDLTASYYFELISNHAFKLA